MSVRKAPIIIALTICCAATSQFVHAKNKSSTLRKDAFHQTLAEQLGWVKNPYNQCGGYYLEPPFVYPVKVKKDNSYVEMTSDETLFSKNGTSILKGKVTLTRFGQQLKSNEAYLYRDPQTGKLDSLEMIGNVLFREPNTLVVGKKGWYYFKSKKKSLLDILYRTSIDSQSKVIGPQVANADIKHSRAITSMSAWGHADEFTQEQPKIFDLVGASFTSCPPTQNSWRVNASHLVIDKNTGRGYATNARIVVKGVPIFYFPYVNFSIDKKRKTGFLWPTFGGSNKWGPYLITPFYWNLAPNYDWTITPGILSKRGLQVSNRIRYLTETSSGNLDFSVLPKDRMFTDFRQATQDDTGYSQSTDPIIQAELNRLKNSNSTRRSLSWNHHSRFNDHWTANVDFTYAGDDYYLRDFGSLNEITQNQLLQKAELNYRSQHWDFIGRLQAYQTLHPIDEPPVTNQYRRFPQLVLNTDYPNQWLGLEYFINDEFTHFDLRNTPGTTTNLPIGNRLHIQPGVSLPLYWPFFYLNPRFQLGLTAYNLYQTQDTGTPKNIRRAVPIFDIATGANFTRAISWLGVKYSQTLEPQLYYTYIPYRNQASIPNFDTTVNTLNYDQLFNYNRFSGLDRFGDANQVGVGVTTRFIDQQNGLEKVRLGVGEIIYFSNRRVTLCNDTSCSDNPQNPDNHRRLSPLSATLNYNINTTWGLGATSIWNPISKQLDNAAVDFHYQPDADRIINLGYGYVRNGDVLSGISVNSSENNLKLTDLSVSWPISRDIKAVGRWSQNWNQHHLQNLLYGLQYDSCCWAVRLVGGRAFTGIDPSDNNKPQYNSEFYIQFALKGLGNIGSGNPNALLETIKGYNTQFGQEF